MKKYGRFRWQEKCMVGWQISEAGNLSEDRGIFPRLFQLRHVIFGYSLGIDMPPWPPFASYFRLMPIRFLCNSVAQGEIMPQMHRITEWYKLFEEVKLDLCPDNPYQWMFTTIGHVGMNALICW